MNLSKASRPSPALVLAALALVFAMVGTAIAGPDAISNKITKSKVKKISKKQANKAIDAAAPGLAVASAESAASAGVVGLYAHVGPTGTATESLSSGITSSNISHPEPGVYCFSGLEGTLHTIDGTVDSADGPGVVEASVIPAGFVACPPTAQAELVTFTPDLIEFTDYGGGFYVRIY
jgi:hypothetical protein